MQTSPPTRNKKINYYHFGILNTTAKGGGKNYFYIVYEDTIENIVYEIKHDGKVLECQFVENDRDAWPQPRHILHNKNFTPITRAKMMRAIAEYKT